MAENVTSNKITLRVDDYRREGFLLLSQEKNFGQ